MSIDKCVSFPGNRFFPFYLKLYCLWQKNKKIHALCQTEFDTQNRVSCVFFFLFNIFFIVRTFIFFIHFLNPLTIGCKIGKSCLVFVSFSTILYNACMAWMKYIILCMHKECITGTQLEENEKTTRTTYIWRKTLFIVFRFFMGVMVYLC